MRLSDGPTDIYALSLQGELEASILPFLPYFSPGRQQVIQRYQCPADRSRTVWAELLARYLLCQAASADWEEVSLEREPGGKPRGRISRGGDSEAWGVSLSHSGSWVLCSLGRGESGVDVETEAEDGEEIAKLVFLPEEAAALQQMPLPDRKEFFLRCWTTKESYLKYTGEGLAGDLSKLDCGALWQRKQPVAVKNFLLPDGAVAGICARRDGLPSQVKYIPLERLKDFLAGMGGERGKMCVEKYF